MAPKKNENGKMTKKVNRGAWTAEEDEKLASYIHTHGPHKWKAVALNAGLNRCGKSCRLRWINYLQPNIKRGNISNEEEDLILRLHKLLGNRWSLIAGRLPGRTDNEIKNYWNSHLGKKVNQRGITVEIPAPPPTMPQDNGSVTTQVEGREETVENGDTEINFDMDELFDFSSEGTYGLDWVNTFLALDEDPNDSLADTSVVSL